MIRSRRKNVQKLMVKKKYESEHYILIFLVVIKKVKSKKKKGKMVVEKSLSNGEGKKRIIIKKVEIFKNKVEKRGNLVVGCAFEGFLSITSNIFPD